MGSTDSATALKRRPTPSSTASLVHNPTFGSIVNGSGPTGGYLYLLPRKSTLDTTLIDLESVQPNLQYINTGQRQRARNLSLQ